MNERKKQMKVSIEEQVKLRKRAKEEMERLEEIMNDSETIKLLDRFKNLFNLCESVYKVILKEHQIKTKGKIDGYLKLTMRQVPYAMTFAGYNIDKSLLNRLFGAKCEYGHTAKKLRAAVTHNLNQKAINEIIEREKDLFGDMYKFLDIIRAA